MVNNCTADSCNSSATAEPLPSVEPRYYIRSAKHEKRVMVDLPRVTREDITVDIEQNVLSIHAKRSVWIPSDWKALHRELSDSDFLLRLRVSNEIDVENMNASLADGVLTVVLPVKDTAKPRRIEVS
ncbi:MAG: Hsp20/alpha crystallin family protein [Verrucomicrobiota bacterium]